MNYSCSVLAWEKYDIQCVVADLNKCCKIPITFECCSLAVFHTTGRERLIRRRLIRSST